MSERDKITTIKLKASTKARFDKLGAMRETSNTVLNNLIDESWHLPKARRLLNEAIAKNEEAKQTGLSKLTVEAADIAIAALTELVEAIEVRE